MDKEETKILLQQIQKGDINAFEKLASSYMYVSFRIAFRILGNKAEAEDAVQDSWIKIWKGISRFRKEAQFETWMYRIISNTCMDYLKKRTYNFNQLDFPASELTMMADHAHNPETLLERNEQLNQLLKMVAMLPPKQRMVFVLRDLEGLSPAEVAAVLQINKDLVKSHLSLARKTLRMKAKEIKMVEAKNYDLRKN